MSSPFCFECADYQYRKGNLPGRCLSKTPACMNFKVQVVNAARKRVKRIKGIAGH